MPVAEATLPIRMNSGMTTSSGDEARVKLSEASRAIAAPKPFRYQMPVKPTTNIENATGIRIINRMNRKITPKMPVATALIPIP